ncbi:hypothetical protein CAEBREN_21839 [Caenorhabditis brenneri]|uniref:C2H2-type domain-containing protein n=1 Tax=Caenorhabditis brenneri TaxID=135651 RepID=G0PHF2_CAEBE|nr:hypothetical protein CAEBREN_21839 [Caenorhabditis brenneri]
MVFKKYEDEEMWSIGSTKELDKLLKQMSLHFLSAENRQEKLIILGLVANSVPLSKIQQYLPNLSPSVMIGLPYGNRKVKTSDGTKVVIPDSIRQLSFSEIFTMYENHRKEENDEKNDFQLSKSSIFRILDICAATDRKASTCVDYYIANGLEAFDKLQEILDGWIKENLTADDILKHLKSGLLDALQYLRTDFRLHIKRFSRVADHCATFGLSDPKQSEYSASCSTGPHAHKHDYKCDRCETLNTILTEIKKFGKNFQDSSQDIIDNDGSDALDTDKKTLEKRKLEVEMIKRHENEILEMKKHILRSAFTDQERQNIVNSLSENEGLLTLDFAQKYLPTWHREKQTDYYGKKGISYHIAHITANVSMKYVQHTFVHIYQHDVSQDSKLVVQTISHILSELKKIGIKAVTLRSDNAGCYHSAPTIHSLHSLMEITGVTIKAYTFSEAQNGKGASDRGASQVKYKAERYIVQGHDITTSQQFFDAMKFEPILNGFSFHHGTITTEDTDVAKWKGISELNHFIVETGGIRAFRYGGIGEGSFNEKTALKPLKGSYVFDSSGFVPTLSTADQEKKSVLQGEITQFWYYSSCVKSKSCGPEPDTASPEIDDQLRNDAEIGNVYACPEPGCSATFLKSSNLDYHVLKDQHKKSPEKVTMRDYALNLFSNFLENVQKEHTAEFVSNALNQFEESIIPTNLAVGHSLPEKKTNKPFGTKVTSWLKGLFDEGLKKKAKPHDPTVVAQRMMTERNADGSLMFSGEELKTTSQISGYFKREAEKRRNKSAAKREAPTESTKKVEELDYTPDEEEHPEAGLARWVKDEAFQPIADRIMHAILQDNYFAHPVVQNVPKA